MSERLTSERLAATRRHPAGSARPRPRLVLLQGGADAQGPDERRGRLRKQLRRAAGLIGEGFATLPEQHFS
ncbi:MAG TPA: hypothetical protein VNF07_11455 [Acidimicrobiales bacterium]|nr:hypothetical protein [Acidimicrobiales bacterium]